ncbi:hypothetical protein [Staphylococcus coagulans]|uniref:hypothetical protein n=1 Tax=Staphylococcus coagulans TaxID=74706 RepID=UPI001FD8FFB8|nr:hypothetical protein [Staphylococcus coagulans]
MKRLIFLLFASLLVLSACGDNEKKEDSKPKEGKNQSAKNQTDEHMTNTNSNNQQTTNQNYISAQEAEQIVSNYYLNRGSNGLQAFEFKTNMARSNANEYYVEHLVRDAAGTPIKFCAIVNRNTGEIVDRFNDMSGEEMAEFERFKKRSPKYHSSDEKESSKQESSPPVEQQETFNSGREQVINKRIDMNNAKSTKNERLRELSKESPHGLQTAPSKGDN